MIADKAALYARTLRSFPFNRSERALLISAQARADTIDLANPVAGGRPLSTLILLGRDVTIVPQRRDLLRGSLQCWHSAKAREAFFQPREA
jgi:hypothetical protein